ncbi:hypothetical protein Csa_013336 [Cucumis sativus]|nr:hypothetical protein Csa_013336 [Cucumis sativus]
MQWGYAEEITPRACQTCLNNSITLLPKNCPSQVEAIGWYEHCMFRYSDLSFFSLMELSPGFYMTNSFNSSDPLRFTQAATNLLQRLTAEAALGDSRLKFAIGSGTIPNSPLFYGAVQCTPDMSAHDCTDCLLGAIAQIREYCDGKIGGRIQRPGCRLRFELDRFFQNQPASSPPPLPSNTTTSSSPRGDSFLRVLVFIFVPINVFGVVAELLIIIIFILRTRKQGRNSRECKDKKKTSF